MAEELLDFLNEIQKFAIKIKIQEVINSLVKDERVNKIINADMVIKYYEKMHEHFDKNPEDFLFPNREWLDESLERLGIDLSNVFDENENPDHIKREEIIVLFLTLWVNMKLQDRDNNHPFIKGPYDLFYLWIYDRVLVIRPTKEFYLQDWDDKVLDHAYKKYGRYSSIYAFNIDEKGKIKYYYGHLNGIINIDKMYKKGHYNKIISDIAYNVKDIKDTISKLDDYILEEKERRNIIIPRNTKFIVREMSGLSNKEYKQLLKYYHTNEMKKASDPYIKEIVDVLVEDYGIEVDSDFISYAKRHAKPKPDSPFQTIAIIDIINAMIKLKDKIGDK
jgi:hypothetical protein